MRYFKSELRNATSELSIPPIHLYAFTIDDFLKMLSSKDENYGKETARNNIVLFGGYMYYRIISEAISNGFRG